MRSDLKMLYPSIYRGIVETDELIKIGDKQFDEYFSSMDDGRRNQFVSTADSYGLSYLERLYEIKSTPEESLEFRRERLLIRMNTVPPFTIRFLRERLDEIIGKDKYNAWVDHGKFHYLLGSWKLGEKPFQDEPYVLHVETVVTDNAWHHEVEVLIGKIKPAHIVYRYTPMIGLTVGITEEIQKPTVNWNYRLNGHWKLGEKPFKSDSDTIWNYTLGSWALGEYPFMSSGQGEILKMRTTPSIQPNMLSEHAYFTGSQITKALINNYLEITTLQITTSGEETTIKYEVPDDAGEVTDIKLFSADGKLQSHSAVFVPHTAEQIVIKHIFYHKEAV